MKYPAHCPVFEYEGSHYEGRPATALDGENVDLGITLIGEGLSGRGALMGVYEYREQADPLSKLTPITAAARQLLRWASYCPRCGRE